MVSSPTSMLRSLLGFAGSSLLRGSAVIGDVLVFLEEAAIELEELVVRAGYGMGVTRRVGDLFAADGLAFAGGDADVLDVEVVGAAGLGRRP